MDSKNLTDQQVDAEFAGIVTEIHDARVFTKYGMRHGRMAVFYTEVALLKLIVVGALLALIFFGQHLELEQKMYFVLFIVGGTFIGILGLALRRFRLGFAIVSLGLTLFFAIAAVVMWQQYLLPFIASLS